jgi:hypothetical protein
LGDCNKNETPFKGRRKGVKRNGRQEEESRCKEEESRQEESHEEKISKEENGKEEKEIRQDMCCCFTVSVPAYSGGTETVFFWNKPPVVIYNAPQITHGSGSKKCSYPHQGQIYYHIKVN